jgi:hypothetical protein
MSEREREREREREGGGGNEAQFSVKEPIVNTDRHYRIA